MNEILLTQPIPGPRELDRLNLFAGRHLGEDELERRQAYADRRLAPLMAALPPGIVQGLEVRTGAGDSPGDTVTVSPGLAMAGQGQSLGLYYPLRMHWHTLIEDYLRRTGAASAGGVFYLTLERKSRYVDSDPEVDPCQRAAFDPTRDARRLVVGTLSLKRLAIPAESAASRERIENWVAANRVDTDFLRGLGHAVPLGLLAISSTGAEGEPAARYRVDWLSQAAGRYLAQPHSGYQVLLRQVREAFERVLLAAGSSEDPPLDYLEEHLRLDFLPAAGDLPLALLRDTASRSPSVGWLPGHLAVDMVVVPQSSVRELIARHLPRRALDLRQSSAARLRLLLAVEQRDYRPDLLDYPETDPQLARDIYRYYMRAHDSWRDWKAQFNKLYFPLERDSLDPATLAALDLPDAVNPPQGPRAFVEQLIDQSRRDEDGNVAEQLEYPYSEGPPDLPAFYRHWEQQPEHGTAAPPEPEEDGLVIRYAIAEHKLEALDNQIRSLRARLEKTRDYLLLQRQQLDNQTVSLSALAGGVAGDGSGLQVARWLPFTQMTRGDSEQLTQRVMAMSTPSDTEDSQATDATTGEPLTNISLNGMGDSLEQATFSRSKINIAAQSSQSLWSTAKALQPTQTESDKNLVFSSTLRKTPTNFSNIQFNMNNRRLDRIAQAPKQALTLPAFETKEFRFGTLEHVQPEIQEYKKAWRGMAELDTTLRGLFDLAEAKTIEKRFGRYPLPKSYDQIEDDLKDEEEAPLEKEQLSPILYEALFDMGKVLTQRIAQMESRYGRIEAALEGKLRARVNMEASMDKLLAQIRAATDELTGLDKRRVEFLGDYGVSQRLLDEDWLAVHERYLERKRILTNRVTGLHYVLVRQTPVSLPLADPLALRYARPGDPVPGCDWDEEAELPEPLQAFFDTLLEVGLDDWRALRPLRPRIPQGPRLGYLEQLRTQRLEAKLNRHFAVDNSARAGHQALSLAGLQRQGRATLQQMSRQVLSITANTSLQQQQRQAARVISLEDLLSAGGGRLQRAAQQLHNRLEQATQCILEHLEQLPPSLRLQWAQLAEDDRLRVNSVAHWPGLERAERRDFNTTRTLQELVAWWFRQLHDQPSADARSAARNMVRACLVQAALGDPAETLKGEVSVPPRRLVPGELLSVNLNRRPRLNETLQLLDRQQRPVAWLQVDDHDQGGTRARIARVSQKSARVAAGFRVVASKASRKLTF